MAPDRPSIEAALRDINTRCAAAAKRTGGGLPPELDLVIVSRAHGTDELYVRVYDHGLLEDAEVLLEPLPEPLAHGATPGSLVETLSDIVETHGEFQGVDQNKADLVRHSDLANGLVDATDRLLTMRPGSGLQPTTEDRKNLSSIDIGYDADWDIKARQTVNKLPWTADPDDHPEHGIIREVIESVEDLNADIVCQLHLEAAYAVDDEPVTVSRAANVTGTFDADADIEMSDQYSFAFRLFALSDSDSDPDTCTGTGTDTDTDTDSDLDESLKALGKALAPRVPSRYTPAIYHGGPAVTHHTERCFLGQGLQQSEAHDVVYRRHVEAVSDWLRLPHHEEWYAAGRFLPVAKQYLAECRDHGSHRDAYPLGREPLLDRHVTTPAEAPRRHVIYSDSPARRRELLSKYIDITRRLRDGPVIALDWSGELATTYFDQYTAAEQDELLGKHARIDVAEMPLATAPRRFSTRNTVVETLTASCSLVEVTELYTTLLSHNSDAITPDPTHHLKAVLEALGQLDTASLSHPEFIAELEHHSPRGAQRVVAESDARRAAATTQWFTRVHDALPADLFGDFSSLFERALDGPDDGVIWLDVSGLETGQSMAGTILIDAIARHIPPAPESGVAATVVFDRAARVPLTETTTDAIPPTSQTPEDGSLAAVVGTHVDCSAAAAATPLHEGAVSTIDTRAESDTATLPTTLPGQRRNLKHQHETTQILTVIPPELHPRETHGTELTPIRNPTTTTAEDTAIDVEQLRRQGLSLTPTPVPDETFLEADYDPSAVHPSRLATRFNKGAPHDTHASERSKHQQSLCNYSADVATDDIACAVCGTRYDTPTAALRCHPDTLDTTPSIHPDRQGAGSVRHSAPDTQGIGYPQPFIERLDFAHDDTLTNVIKTTLTTPSHVTGLDDALTSLRDGLTARLDGDTYNDLSLDVLHFLQACEVLRVGGLPLDAASMIPLRNRCLADTPITDLTDYLNEAHTPQGKYYELTHLAEHLTPITTLTTSSSTPPTPGLDDSYSTTWARHRLAARFDEMDDVTETEILHYPGDELGDAFPLDAIDVAAIDADGRITNIGLVISPTTMGRRVTPAVLDWAATIPATVPLIAETDAVTRYLAAELAPTEHFTLNRADHLTPLPDTDYRTSTITTWITWPPNSNITLQSMSSLTT